MRKDILINSTSKEIRIAITEDGKLVEFFVESPDQNRNIGDIYLGKVAKVMPGIRAAFINLGFQQDAFLHFSDINYLDEMSNMLEDDTELDEDDDEPTQKENSKEKLTPEDLNRGQDIIVQITKEPVGNKGVRVTSKVSLPGRYLVLMPFNKKIATSKKIYQFREKQRLKKIIKSVLPKGFGVIVRTVALGQDENLILDDLNKLLKTWNEIEEKVKTQKSPSILYKDASTTSSVIRDLFKDDVSKILVDSKKLHKEISTYLELTSPDFVNKVELYNRNQPLFDAFNIERQILESLSKKVWVKGAGYIVIETTEAMTVVDVNSGKYAKNTEQEINSLNTNLEAGKEIVRQLRLRDIGGIIVVDFIDLYDEKNRRKLYEELKKEFRKDRAKASLLPMSDFGLVQITRQRVRQNILNRVFDTCPMCKGTGNVMSKTGFLTEIERWLQRYSASSGPIRLKLRVNPIISGYLRSGFISEIFKMNLKYRLWIKVENDTSLGLDEYKFISLSSNEDVTTEFEF